jgi:lysophospholipase L1-like esterase
MKIQISKACNEKRKFWVLICSFAFCLLPFAFFSGCAKREIKNIDSQGQNIICFGDSVTFGYGVNKDEDYPAELARLIQMPVINAGIDGDTTVEAIKRLHSDVLERDPLLVIIEFGGNDFLRRIPKEDTVNNIREMVDKIQAKGAMVAIVDISAGIFLKEYRLEFYNIARKSKTIFIPKIMGEIITNPRMKSDFIHPNADGYKMIAQRTYRAVMPYLNQNELIKKSEK